LVNQLVPGTKTFDGGKLKMKINCPKCQFENQADSTRVVCARCATIIEVRLDQGSSADTNGKRQTARLPFGLSAGNNQAPNNQQLNQHQDVYATRLGDDFDDVLDIPRPEQPSYQTGYESQSVYDDVFASPSYDSAPAYDFSSPERRSNSVETFRPSVSRQRETQDYINEAEPEFMGWPVLPDDSKGEEGGERAYSSTRDGLFTRIVATVLIFGVLVSVAYYFVSNRTVDNRVAANKEPATSTTANSDSQKTEEGAAASEDTKVANAGETASSEQPRSPGRDNQTPVAVPPTKPDGTRGVESSQPNTSIVIPNNGEFTIQIASFSDQVQANDRAAKLRPAGISGGSVVRVDLPNIGIRYRVYIGGFATREEAVGVAVQLQAKNIIQEYFVTRR
jgi:cell division septation protein DedD